MDTHEAFPRSSAGRTRLLLRLGAAAGVLYIVVGLAQALTRDGFDMRRHALSLLSLGDAGWIQVANFFASGALVLAGALGVRRLLRGRRGGTWGPILLGVWGLGLIGAGVFPPDPAPGFPPGTPAPDGITTRGMLHFVFGALGFYALVAACLVFARRSWALGRRPWAVYSALSGIGFLSVFMGVASGSTAAAAMLAFYAAVGWIWVWHTLLMFELASEASPRNPEPASRRGSTGPSGEFDVGLRDVVSDTK